MCRRQIFPLQRFGDRAFSAMASVTLVYVFVVFTALSGCVTVSPFDPVALRQAEELKAESLALLDKATDPPQLHAEAIAQLRQHLQQVLEYEMGKTVHNTVAIGQWKLMNDPQGNLMGGFLKKWEADQVGQSPEFLAGVKSLVERAFDQIIQAERQKPTL